MFHQIARTLGLSVVATFLYLSSSSHAAPDDVCIDTQLDDELLGLCRAYVTRQDCREPAFHDGRRCEFIRRVFYSRSGGLDLDDILALSFGEHTVPATGGSVVIPSVGTFTFPSGAFEHDTVVSVEVGQDEAIAQTFNEFAAIFRPASRLSYEVTVSTGILPPLSETVDVQLHLPSDFVAQVPDGFGIELFAIVEQSSELSLPYKSFELFESQLNVSGDAISATLPSAVFFQDLDGEYKAVFTLAPTPGEKEPLTTVQEDIFRSAASVSQSTSQCQAASIACPVSGGCDVNSPFVPARQHPVTGQTRPHYGVDYKAATGTPILSAANGTIERSYSSSSYGETIIVRHDDGSATLYAHLQTRGVQAGDTVTKGQTIATSNNTGISSGPHLHFEYVPNGQIIQSKSRIDPDACVDSEGSGSVTVSDSGSLADDAFAVAIDGFSIGQTAIGASNTLAISNLKVGQHTLTLSVTVAPDDVGTYTVVLNDGLIFTDGTVSKTGSAPQGATLSWEFIVP